MEQIVDGAEAVKEMLKDLYDQADVVILNETMEGKERVLYREVIELEIRRRDGLKAEDKLVLKKVSLDAEFRPIGFDLVLEPVSDTAKVLVSDGKGMGYTYIIEGVHSDGSATTNSFISRDELADNGETTFSEVMAEFDNDENAWVSQSEGFGRVKMILHD